MSNEPRVVRCTIEMDLVEGRDFNLDSEPFDDNTIQEMAIIAFLGSFISDLEDYVQTKIVEDVS